MKKKFTFITTILCLSLVLGGCTNGKTNDKNTDKTNEQEMITQNKLSVIRPSAYSNVNDLILEPGSCISIIGRYANDSYWKEVENGAKQAVADLNAMLGYKGDQKIKLVYSAPEVRDDVNEQVNILDEELNRYPNAIGIASIDTTACMIQFDLAAENSIPIVTFDSGSDYQHVASHIATDNLEAAKTAATQLAYAMEEEGEVAVFVQDSISMTAKNRLQGFLDAIENAFPNISVVNIYRFDELDTMRQTIATERNAALSETEEDVDPATITQEDVVAYILEKNPNLKGIYTTNLDTTQLVASVLNELERVDLKVVGFDGGDEQLELLENDVLEGLIVQNPYGMGYATVIAAARVSLGLANESFVNTGYTWVTKENMNKKEIKAMLY